MLSLNRALVAQAVLALHLPLCAAPASSTMAVLPTRLADQHRLFFHSQHLDGGFDPARPITGRILPSRAIWSGRASTC